MKMEITILDNLNIMKEMELEFYYLMTGVFTVEIGKIIKPRAKVV